jgi:tetratricopeptide (TPR) repeat protein
MIPRQKRKSVKEPNGNGGIGMANAQTGLSLQDQFDRAEEALQRGESWLALDIMSEVIFAYGDKIAPAYVILARAHLQLENWSEGLHAIEKALHLHPHDDLSHALHGFFLGKYREIRAAHQAFQNALTLNPNRPITHFWYAQFLYEQTPDLITAKQYVQNAISLQGEVADFHLLLGLICERLQQDAEAGKAFREAVRLSPDSLIALTRAGEHTLERDHNPRGAFDFFRRALQQEPKNPYLLSRFMTCLSARKRWLYLFWHYNLRVISGGNMRWLTVIGLWLLIQVLQYLGILHPEWMPVISWLVTLYVLYALYTWLVLPVFRFLIKRGWVR